MRQKYTTNAINLKSYDYGEADKIVMMYSKDKGLIRCLAKGSKKPNGKLCGRMDMFVANNLLLTKGKSMDTVSQAEIVNSFFRIRQNTEKMFYSIYCAETIKNFGEENDENSDVIYDIFYSVLDRISNSTTEVEIILAAIRFQLKIMQVLGYNPEFNVCNVCREKIGDNYSKFSFEHGGLICLNHKTSDEKLLRIHPKIKDFLKTLQETDFNILTDYDKLANVRVSKPCFDILKEYIEHCSPKKFKSTKVLEAI
ncbi:MAG: DNA repair protein RecO [Candidatus Gastranaerophilales bacterium]|nr:DNA repair protein RecO [Candidatus Gastranaerophilales bacterium]